MDVTVEIFFGVKIYALTFRFVTSCSLAGGYRSFGEKYCSSLLLSLTINMEATTQGAKIVTTCQTVQYLNL
jgi:hypothetical protein